MNETDAFFIICLCIILCTAAIYLAILRWNDNHKKKMEKDSPTWTKIFAGSTHEHHLRWKIEVTIKGKQDWIDNRVFPKHDGLIAFRGLIGTFVEERAQNLASLLLQTQETPFEQIGIKTELEMALHAYLMRAMTDAHIYPLPIIKNVHVRYVAPSLTRGVETTK